MGRIPALGAAPAGPRVARTCTATRPRAYRFGTLDAIWQCKLHCHSTLSVQPRVGDTATRARAYRSYCHSGLNVPPPHVHRRVAVQTILPLAPERTDRTATRPRAYRFGTFDAIWQCKLHCHSAPSVRPRVGGTATRPRAYRSHCHSGLNVPRPHVHRRVAVHAVPRTSRRSGRTNGRGDKGVYTDRRKWSLGAVLGHLCTLLRREGRASCNVSCDASSIG